MGRKNRRTHEAVELRRTGSLQAAESHADGDWHVRRIASAAATKNYRCPGCQQEVPSGTAHIVAWRADRPDGDEYRRHWHTPCWNARARRRPN